MLQASGLRESRPFASAESHLLRLWGVSPIRVLGRSAVADFPFAPNREDHDRHFVSRRWSVGLGNKVFPGESERQRVRLLVDELESRVVPKLLPGDANGIHIMEESTCRRGLSNAMVQFVGPTTREAPEECSAKPNQFRPSTRTYGPELFLLQARPPGTARTDLSFAKPWFSSDLEITSISRRAGSPTKATPVSATPRPTWPKRPA